MRKKELNACTASMGLHANAIAERQPILQQQQRNHHYQIQHDIEINKHITNFNNFYFNSFMLNTF